MSKFSIHRNFYLFLVAGFVCFFVSFYYDYLREQDSESKATRELRHFEQRRQASDEVLSIFKNKLNIEISRMQKTFESLNIENITAKSANRYSFQIYESDSLICWNNNAIENLDLKLAPLPFSLQILNNGIFLTGTKKTHDTVYVLLYLIRNNYQLSNNYLKNTLNPDLNLNYESKIERNAKEGFSKVELHEGVLFYVFFEVSVGGSKINVYLFLMGLLLMCMAAGYLLEFFFKLDYVFGLSFLVGLAMLIRLFMVSFHYPNYLYSTELFGPRYFASSNFLQSFGDLILTVIFLASAITASTHYYNKLKQSGTLKLSKIGKAILLFYIFISAFLTFKVIHDLVVDSKISFDLTNVFELSWYSLAGVVVIILMYLITIHLVHIFSKEYVKGKWVSIRNVIQVGIVFILIIIFQLLQNDNFNWNWEKLLMAALFLILLAIAKKIFVLKGFIVRQMTYALIFVNLAAVSFYNDGNEKELEDRILYASRLTTQIDYKAEELLKSKEKEILNDSLFLTRCFKNSIGNTDATQYVVANYFNSYLEKYDCSVFLFLNDSSNVPGLTYTLKDFEDIFKIHGVQGICANFRFVKSPFEFFGYIGRFEIQQQQKNLKIYMLLKLQPYQEDNLLPILIAEKSTSFKRNKLKYSYAIYNNNQLMQQSGAFQYQTRNTFGNNTKHYQLLTKDGFSHLLYKDSEELLVVVSSRPPSLLSILANALCLYVIALLLGGLILFLDFVINLIFNKALKGSVLEKIRIAKHRTNTKFHLANFKFSTRIVINILGLVLLIFTATSIITIRYIDFKIGEEAKSALVSKLKSINQYFSEDRLLQGNGITQEGEAIVLQASTLFASDINIYDERGKIILSSKPEIFKEGLISKNINYDAFDAIVYKKASLFTQNESIGDLQFTSYYQPYYDKSSKIKYIINTPYFTRTLEYNAQISMFIINFLNLYVALLLIMFVIAVWVARGTTQPFILLRDKIKALRLDKENELLTWQRKDEIGELIKQYNAMVLDLKESKQNLANAERIGAWREMAKQVAHEIKNPLTPMKLNLQYLQKAVEENDQNLYQKFRRVSKSLIEQIDSLTELANNFSNFGKTPDSTPQLLNLADEVEQIVELYKATDFITINTQINSPGISVMMDKNHFSRALGNVIKNAIQSVPQGKEGVIEIILSSQDNQGILMVKDNGVGIPKEMENLIFVPNFSTKSSGSGIGLSIAKTLIEIAGGTISFDSNHAGTTFIVKLPLYNPS